MTNQQHPITPPPELVEQWIERCLTSRQFATMAFQAGADHELEACLQWFSEFYSMETWMQKDLERFREHRRPKPPSLKEQALLLLDEFSDPEGLYLDVKSHNTIRRALEQLDD
jgi:hypothetical protein